MPISKKDRIQREHRKAEAAGTRTPVKPNGLPVKPPKPTSICANCRKEIVNTNLIQLETHAGTHNAQWTKERCWPNDFPSADVAPAAAPTSKVTTKAGGKVPVKKEEKTEEKMADGSGTATPVDTEEYEMIEA